MSKSVLHLLDEMAELAPYEVPAYTCPAVDYVISRVRAAIRETWDSETKTQADLKAAMQNIGLLLDPVRMAMEKLRTANSELREVAEPAVAIGKAALARLLDIRETIAREEKLTQEELDAILDGKPLAREVGNPYDFDEGVERIIGMFVEPTNRCRAIQERLLEQERSGF